VLTILRLRLYISASDDEIIPDDGPPPLPPRGCPREEKKSGRSDRKREKKYKIRKPIEDVPGSL